MSDVLRDRIKSAFGWPASSDERVVFEASDAVLRAAATEVWWCQDDNGDGYVQHPPIKAHPQPPVYCYFGGARNHRQGCGPMLLVDPAHLAGSVG